MTQPKLKWECHIDRDFAYVNASPRMWLSICDVGDGSREWRAYCLVWDRVGENGVADHINLIQDEPLIATDIVDAMAECERMVTEALAEVAGGLV